MERQRRGAGQRRDLQLHGPLLTLLLSGRELADPVIPHKVCQYRADQVRLHALPSSHLVSEKETCTESLVWGAARVGRAAFLEHADDEMLVLLDRLTAAVPHSHASETTLESLRRAAQPARCAALRLAGALGIAWARGATKNPIRLMNSKTCRRAPARRGGWPIRRAFGPAVTRA